MIIDTMDVNIIKLFKIHLNKSLNKINKYLKMDPRQRILFKDIIYYCSYMIGNNFSYDLVKLKIDNILDVPKKSLVKNRNKIPTSYFCRLNKNLFMKIQMED